MAERERLFRLQPLHDLLLDRPVPGKPRQRARVEVAFLEDLEAPAHHPEGMGEAPDLIPAVHAEVVIKIPLGDQGGRLFEPPERPGDVVGDEHYEQQPHHQAYETEHDRQTGGP